MTTSTRLGRNAPSLRYLAAPFRWFFRSRRRVLAAAAVLLGMMVAPPLWWSIQLVGLPDIGDPLDMEAFRAFRIPDERDAFVLYQQAMDRLKSLDVSKLPTDANRLDLYFARWSRADPAVRRWMEENREALTLFRRGTERPDCLIPGLPPIGRFWSLGGLQAMALLEASRLEEQGDLTGAWGWYRADLRAIHHVNMHAALFWREWAHRWHIQLADRIATWAVDPRTTRAMIRLALDDAVGCESLAPSDSFTLAVEYSNVDRALEESPGLFRGRMPPWLSSLAFVGAILTPERARSIYVAWRFWRREPERSRRVIRLVIANSLAYDELSPDRRPPPDPGITGPLDLHALGPDAPAKARALSPRALDRWLATAPDAEWLLRAWDLRGVRINERADYRALVVLLAGRLYHYDHGADPPSDEALVGPYLKGLPDDGLGDASATTGGRGAHGEGARE
jgi:hypothetical protein